MDIFLSIISVALIGFMVFNIWITRMLYRFAKDGEWKYPALNERFISASIKTAGNVLLGLLGANRILAWALPQELVLVMLVVAMLLHSLPPVVWYFYLKTGRFHTFSDYPHTNVENDPNKKA